MLENSLSKNINAREHMNIQSFTLAALLAASAISPLQSAEPVVLWSSTFDSGPAATLTSPYPRLTAVDGAGNGFVLGNTGDEWVLVKYLSTGAADWTNRFRGSAAGSASGYGLAVDTAGNAHVTGYHSGSTVSGAGLVTVKYHADGSVAWTNVFSGIGYGVALDSSGNVYVAGSSTAFGTASDFITLKYLSDGVPVWTNRYNGPGSSPSEADDVRTLSVDGDGNVIVTGTSQRRGRPGSDFATVKYQTDGTPVWTNRFEEAGFTLDSVNDLAVDASGNVFITGDSREGSTEVSDYITIKYDADGAALWTNRFNSLGNGRDSSGAVKVDQAGNAYVYGGSGGKNKAVIKYAPDGTPAWTNLFSANIYSESRGFDLDADGNAYMTAGVVGVGADRDFVIVKILSNGTSVLTNHFSGPAGNINVSTSLALDHDGNLYVGAQSFQLGAPARSLMIRYPATATPGWTNQFGLTSGGNDNAVKAVADAAGNIYAIGDSSGYGTSTDYITVKFRADGTPVWTNRYDGGRNNLDEVRDVAVDSAGNVYVAGNSRDNPSNRDDPGYLTIKYFSDGTPAWTNRFNPTLTVDHVSGIVVDQGGNAFVTGSTGHGDTATTIKYRPDGTTEWMRSYRGSPGGTYPYATAMDSGGNIYVAGMDQTNGWFVVKYRSNGVVLWNRLFNSGRGAVAEGIVVDKEDNVYVTGVSSSGSYAYNDYIVVKYTPDGTALWTNRYDGPANNNDNVLGTAVDKFGSVYVTGTSGIMFTSSAGADYATIKYLADGTPAWTNRYDGVGNAFDAGTAVGVDDLGNVFVTGNSTGSGTGIDHVTIKYRSDGSAAWTNRLTGPALLGSDTVWNVLPADGGDVVVVGTIITADGSGDWILYRLADTPAFNTLNLALISENAVRLRFSGNAGEGYRFERAPTANGPWTTIATLTAPAHGMIEYVDLDGAREGAFYRATSP